MIDVLYYLEDLGAWGMYWRIGLAFAASASWFVGTRFALWMRWADNDGDAMVGVMIVSLGIPGIAWLGWPLWIPALIGFSFTGDKLARINEAKERLS